MESEELDQSIEGDEETSGVDAPSEEDAIGQDLPEPPEESEEAVPDEATDPSEDAE